MASTNDILRFIESRGIAVQNLSDKNEILSAYKKAFGEKGDVIHTYVTKLGSLNCLVKTNSANPGIVVVAIHGFGANKEDLEDLAEKYFINCKEVSAAFVFPGATIQLTQNVESYGWWLVDVQELGRRMLNMKFRQIVNDHPKGLEDARNFLLELIEEASIRFGVDLRRFVLCGFSQGAMLSFDLLLHLRIPPFYVGLFSCGPMMQEEYHELLNSMSEERRNQILKTPIFQTHGNVDIIIPVVGGELVQQFLHNEKFNNEYKVFDGGHTLSDSLVEYFLLKVMTKVPSLQS